MYAIIETGGKQYKITIGSYIVIEKINKHENKKIIFKNIILIFYKNKIITNKKKINNYIIKGKIIENIKNKKIKILKFKRRKHYKKIAGHRQKLQKVKIYSIKKNNGT